MKYNHPTVTENGTITVDDEAPHESLTMNHLLFLCTGNYYRSRFCEEYFNDHARRGDLSWWAHSRGLAPDISVFGNPGPLSPQTRHALQALGITLDAHLRDPLSAQPVDFHAADRIIALSQQEHQPMVERFFPAFAPIVEYWEVGDLPVESPTRAIEKMIGLMDQLLKEIE